MNGITRRLRRGPWHSYSASRSFHTYLYGRKFTLVTDHKPLTTLLGPKKGIPSLAAARLQRWALLLAAYSYDIEFKPTQRHGNADGLSRLPLKTATLTAARFSDPVTLFNIAQVEALPITAKQVQSATRQDPVLSKVLHFTRSGWPSQVPETLVPYSRRRQELAIEDGCLMWGIRVVIPKKLREAILQQLHQDHPGISRMKAVARSHVW